MPCTSSCSRSSADLRTDLKPCDSAPDPSMAHTPGVPGFRSCASGTSHGHTPRAPPRPQGEPELQQLSRLLVSILAAPLHDAILQSNQGVVPELRYHLSSNKASVTSARRWKNPTLAIDCKCKTETSCILGSCSASRCLRGTNSSLSSALTSICVTMGHGFHGAQVNSCRGTASPTADGTSPPCRSRLSPQLPHCSDCMFSSCTLLRTHKRPRWVPSCTPEMRSQAVALVLRTARRLHVNPIMPKPCPTFLCACRTSEERTRVL